MTPITPGSCTPTTAPEPATRPWGRPRKQRPDAGQGGREDDDSDGDDAELAAHAPAPEPATRPWGRPRKQRPDAGQGGREDDDSDGDDAELAAHPPAPDPAP